MFPRIFLKLILCLAAIFSLIAAGCAPAATESIEEVFSPTPSLTTAPTIDWFPATATPTFIVLPTSTPNPASIPSFGNKVIDDTFTKSGDWQEMQNANGIISVANQSITLAVKADHGNLVTFRQNTIVSDFYLVTTVKRVALCKTDDQFGVLFRAQNEQNYYRLMINCQGQIAVQQMAGSTPSFLMDWTPNAEVSLWQPYTVGIWAKGQTLRIYVNDHLQVEITRGTFDSGGIGFYARAAGDTPLTVSFSDLSVYELPKSISNGLPSSTP